MNTIECDFTGTGNPVIVLSMKANEIDERIGKNLRRIREAHHISQKHLAELIGTPAPRISEYETGAEGMGKDIMARICRVLKVELWEFYWTEKMPIIVDEHEREALERYRREQTAGVAEDVAKYGEFRISEAARSRKKVLK